MSKFAEKIKQRIENPKNSRQLLIGFLGDSVTEGCFEIFRDKNGNINTNYKTQCGYSYKLKSLFDLMLPNASVNILNAGISGGDAVEGANRVERDIIERKPDLCIVCFGLNDAVNANESIETYKSAMCEIFKKLKAANIETICLTPNMMATYPAREGIDPDMMNDLLSIPKTQNSGKMDEIVNAEREAAEEYGVAICDCYKKWKTLYENGADVTRLLANRVNHPVEDMHWLFAWSLFNTIMDI